MILISGPAIATLRLHTRKWAHEAIRRGRFGAAVRHRGILYVDLRAVEASEGIQFTEAQIALATQDKPDRILHVSDHSQKEAGHGNGEAQT